MVDLTGVRYLAWEDAFEAEFEDGLSFLEPHATSRKANKISPKAEAARAEKDGECHEGFFVHYNNGQTAQVVQFSGEDLLRHATKLAENLELQFLGHAPELRSARRGEDDLKRCHCDW